MKSKSALCFKTVMAARTPDHGDVDWIRQCQSQASPGRNNRRWGRADSSCK